MRSFLLPGGGFSRRSRRIRRPDSPHDLAAALALDDGDVVLALEIEPELCAVSEITPEPDGGVGGDGRAAVQDVRDAPGGAAPVARQPIGPEIACPQLAPRPTRRMGRRPPHPTPSGRRRVPHPTPHPPAPP